MESSDISLDVTANFDALDVSPELEKRAAVPGCDKPSFDGTFRTPHNGTVPDVYNSMSQYPIEWITGGANPNVAGYYNFSLLLHMWSTDDKYLGTPGAIIRNKTFGDPSIVNQILWGHFPTWKYEDCNSTSLLFNWTIPADIYNDTALYQIAGSDFLGKTKWSPFFRILSASTSSTATNTTTVSLIQPTTSANTASIYLTSTLIQPPITTTTGPPTLKNVPVKGFQEVPSTLPTRIKAGIGIGCVLGAIFLALAVSLFFWRRMRRQRRRPTKQVDDNSQTGYEKPELDSARTERQHPELDGEVRCELHDEQGPYEVDGQISYELDANERIISIPTRRGRVLGSSSSGGENFGG